MSRSFYCYVHTVEIYRNFGICVANIYLSLSFIFNLIHSTRVWRMNLKFYKWCSSSREDDWINRFYEENRSWQGVPFRNSGRARAAPADPSSTPTLPRPPRSAATTGDPRSPRGALSLGRPALSHLSGQSGAKASGNRAASASVSKRLSSQDQPGGNIRSHRTDLPRQPPKDAAPLRRWRSTWHRDSAQSRKPSWPWAHLAFILSARKPAPRRTNLLLWSWQPYVSVG